MEQVTVTVVTIVHNEIAIARQFLQYYRALGVSQFMVLDDHSDDGTFEFLESQSDVNVFRDQHRGYPELKTAWREEVGDASPGNTWLLFVDFDEHFVYPRQDEMGLGNFCRLLEKKGFDALAALLIDMYPDDSHGLPALVAGQPLGEYAPFFDSSGYAILRLRNSQARGFPTPRYVGYGGARARVFHPRTGHSGLATRLATAIASPRSRSLAGKGSFLERLGDSPSNYFFRNLSVPSLNIVKVPLLKWRHGTKFSGGVHRASKEYRLSRTRGALLHYKLRDDFWARTKLIAERATHAKQSAEYKHYLNFRTQAGDLKFISEISAEFRGWQDLARFGLVRY